MTAENSPEQTPDWLDGALKNHLVADEGFYDRVLAVARGQRRNRLLLRAFAVVLVVGFVGALGSVVVDKIFEQRGSTSEEAEIWVLKQRAEFHSELTRLDGLPALARRSGKDAAAILNPVEFELLDENGPRAACLRALAAERAASRAEAAGDAVTGAIDAACDTGFIDGLAAYDEWRWARSFDIRENAGDAGAAIAELARSHLRKARKNGGAAYAAAANDVANLGRLLYGHTYFGHRVFAALIEETQAAEAAGASGGYVAPLGKRDLSIATRLWQASPGFASVFGSAEDFALVDGSRSVLSCGARTDVWSDLRLQEIFFDDGVRSAALSTEGCSPRVAGGGSWMLFAEQPTTSARLGGALLELPLVRRIGARAVNRISAPVSLTDAVQKKQDDE